MPRFDIRTASGRVLRFRVRAGEGGGPGPGPTPTAPAAPSGLTATAISSSRIDLAWADNSDDETAFEIQQSPDGTTWTTVATPAAGSVGSSRTGLVAATAYSWRVRAVNAVGPSDWSNVATATTLAAPAPGATLAEFGVTNLDPSASPARTLTRVGHPFAPGDLPTGTRIAATLVRADASEVAVPVQVSARATHPSGSLRFGAIYLDLPSLAASETATVRLESEAGDWDDALPGGATPASVAAALAALDLRIDLTDLYRGRERIGITSKGSGYSNANPPVIAFDSVLDIDGNTVTPTGGVTLKTPDGGITDKVQAVWIDVPARPLASAPTFTVSNPTGTVNPATFTAATIPTRDGSGDWHWSVADQVAFSGWLDAQGRTRCEAIAAGPLCVAFRLWGPVVDDTGGAEHPEVAVSAWVTAYLKADGSIERVEFLPKLEQGWIEDLNGGATVADLQFADVSVSVGGSPLPRRSWDRLHMVHHTARALVEVNDTEGHNWIVGGSDWLDASGSPIAPPAILPTFDNYYWRSAGFPHAYDLEKFDPAKGGSPIVPASDTAPAPYNPRPSEPMGRFCYSSNQPIASAPGTPWNRYCNRAFNNGGENDHLGWMMQPTVRAHLTQEPGYLRSDMATALFGDHVPIRINNARTGRIPVLVPHVALADTPNALMGAHRSGFDDAGTVAAWGPFYRATRQMSDDIPVYVVADGTRCDGSAVGDPTNTEGGWQSAANAFDSSHFPVFAYYAYLRTAAPWLLDTMHVHANQQLMGRSPSSQPVGARWPSGLFYSRSIGLGDGTTLYGRFIMSLGTAESRTEGRAWQVWLQAAAVTPDAAPERPYIDYVRTANAHGAKVIIDTMPQSFRDLGGWAQPILGYAPPPGYDVNRTVPVSVPWEEGIIFAARAFEAHVFERPADTMAYLNQQMKLFRRMAGGYPGDDTCSWGLITYYAHLGYGLDYATRWADLPSIIDTGTNRYFENGARFGTDGWVNLPCVQGRSNDLLLSPDDRIYLTPLMFIYPSASPPPELASPGWYRIAQVDFRERTATAADATGYLTCAAHGYADGDLIEFDAGVPSGFAGSGRYYVRDADANGFRLAATPGGAAIPTAAVTGSWKLAVSRIKIAPDADGSTPYASFSAATPLTNWGVGYGIDYQECFVPDAARPHTITAHYYANLESDTDLTFHYGRAKLAVALGLIGPDDPWLVNTAARIAVARQVNTWKGSDEYRRPKYCFGSSF